MSFTTVTGGPQLALGLRVDNPPLVCTYSFLDIRRQANGLSKWGKGGGIALNLRNNWRTA